MSITKQLLFLLLVASGPACSRSDIDLCVMEQPPEKQPMSTVKSDSQILSKSGSKFCEITSDGEVWINGDKKGSIESNGEIWVAGDKEGSIESDGAVWKAGDKIGDVTEHLEVWFEGDKIGEIESDGSVWRSGSSIGTTRGGDARRAAVVFFFNSFTE